MKWIWDFCGDFARGIQAIRTRVTTRFGNGGPISFNDIPLACPIDRVKQSSR